MRHIPVSIQQLEISLGNRKAKLLNQTCEVCDLFLAKSPPPRRCQAFLQELTPVTVPSLRCNTIDLFSALQCLVLHCTKLVNSTVIESKVDQHTI